MFRELFNIFTGFIGFVTWAYLTKRSPENTVKIAIACICMLLGFSGRDTFLEIIELLIQFK